MQFEVKEIDSIKRRISVSVPAEALKEIETKTLNDLRRSVALPGFRKGRAPLGMVKKSYAEYLNKEVLETTISRYYSRALSESGLQVVSQGTIQNVNFTSINEGLKFDIDVEVQPAIELKKYTGLQVDKEKVSITDEMVQEALQNIQESYATTQLIEVAEEGHIVKMSVQELGDGDVPIIGRKYDDITVELGSGSFDVELEKQLAGVKEGEKRIIRRQTPSADEKELPKTESYQVDIQSVEKRELPPIDDELAKNLGEDDIDNLVDLRKILKERMTENLQRRTEQQMNQRVIDELLKENPFDVPESMINNYLDYVVEDVKKKNPKAKVDESVVRQNYRVDAIHSIRWHMLKDKLIDVENIEVNDDEVFQRIDGISIDDKQKAEIKSNKDFLNRIRGDMLEEKVLKYLMLNAVVTEVDPPVEPQQGAAVGAPVEGEPSLIVK